METREKLISALEDHENYVDGYQSVLDVADIIEKIYASEHSRLSGEIETARLILKEIEVHCMYTDGSGLTLDLLNKMTKFLTKA